MLYGLNVTMAVGSDSVSPRLLKNCYLELCHPLFLLFGRVSSEVIISCIMEDCLNYTCL